MKPNQSRLKISLFMNYLVHGFGMIILTQNLISLAKNWNSSLAVASFVLSGIGIGRLVSYLIMGMISDHLGRKITLLIGVSTYLIFFLVTPLNHSITIAYGLAILAGIANSALDSATYPLLAEISKNSGASSVLIKAFISVGEFILPLVVLFLNNHQLWFGFSFVLPIIILVINLINILMIKFPTSSKISNQQAVEEIKISKSKKIIVTIALFVYGYTSMAIMIWFTQWITIFAKKISFSNTISHFLLSLYSIGSITGVIVVVFLLNKFNIRKHLFLILNLVSLIAITIISFSHVAIISSIAALLFGFSAAGGLMQIALNTLLNIYPKHKGVLTAWFFIFGSLASFSVPIITGFIVKFPSINIMAGDIGIAIIGLVVAIIMFTLIPQINTINEARKSINGIDKRLIRLLEKRFSAVKTVGEVKRQQNLNVHDPKRETLILKRVAKNTKNKELISYNQNIIQNIMNNAKKYENSITK